MKTGQRVWQAFLYRKPGHGNGEVQVELISILHQIVKNAQKIPHLSIAEDRIQGLAGKKTYLQQLQEQRRVISASQGELLESTNLLNRLTGELVGPKKPVRKVCIIVNGQGNGKIHFISLLLSTLPMLTSYFHRRPGGELQQGRVYLNAVCVIGQI